MASRVGEIPSAVAAYAGGVGGAARRGTLLAAAFLAAYVGIGAASVGLGVVLVLLGVALPALGAAVALELPRLLRERVGTA